MKDLLLLPLLEQAKSGAGSDTSLGQATMSALHCDYIFRAFLYLLTHLLHPLPPSLRHYLAPW